MDSIEDSHMGALAMLAAANEAKATGGVTAEITEK